MKQTDINEKNRYSDQELEEFRQIILDKLAKARKDLDLLSEAYTNNGSTFKRRKRPFGQPSAKVHRLA